MYLSKHKICLLFIRVAVLLLIVSSNFAFADSLTAIHEYDEFILGGELTVFNQVEYSGSLTAMAIKASLPPGWSLISVDGPNIPELKPKSDASGNLEFVWVNMPPSPIEFTYTVSIPFDSLKENTIKSVVLYRRMSGELFQELSPNPLIVK